MKLSKIKRAVLAEFVAVALLVFVGCGTAVSTQWMRRPDGNPTNLNDSFLTSVALAFGIGIAVLAYSIAPHLRMTHQPGCHFRVYVAEEDAYHRWRHVHRCSVSGGHSWSCHPLVCTDVPGTE